MRLLSFEAKAFEEYQRWIEEDKKTALRICDLIKDISRNPFTGLGKPEALKHQFKGYWSRRIDQQHRLVYKVSEEQIIIASCYSHYQ